MSTVVVIIGREEDLCCQRVRGRLEEAGRELIFLPEDKLFPHFGFAWRVAGDGSRGSVSYKGLKADFEDVSGVLGRFYSMPVSAEEFATKDGRYITAEWNALLSAWLPSLRCPVVNRLRPELWYKSHLNVTGLISLAPSLKLKLPRVMVTSEVEEARRFYRRSEGGTRYMPLTQAVGFPVSADESFDKLTALSGTLPFHLIEAVEGARAEAFVVGERVVVVDEEGAPERGHAAEVGSQCLDAAETLGLAFCSFSLIRSARDEWFCTGADRMPQLYRLNEEALAEITGGLYELLTAGERKGRA